MIHIGMTHMIHTEGSHRGTPLITEIHLVEIHSITIGLDLAMIDMTDMVPGRFCSVDVG